MVLPPILDDRDYVPYAPTLDDHDYAPDDEYPMILLILLGAGDGVFPKPKGLMGVNNIAPSVSEARKTEHKFFCTQYENVVCAGLAGIANARYPHVNALLALTQSPPESMAFRLGRDEANQPV